MVGAWSNQIKPEMLHDKFDHPKTVIMHKISS